MKIQRCFCIAAGALLAALVAVGHAQGTKPWDQPGTKAGQVIIGPNGGKMVWVPPGEFNMGATDLEQDELPIHRVRITRGFWIGQCTVTNAQYRRYCKQTGVKFPVDSNQGPDHPVTFVSWYDAQAYCKHYGLSLPTEAQWEYAARGPKDYKYPWGNKWDPLKCCNAENLGPKGKTFPVGSFPAGASWCGALDMAGNVYQWCKDWYDPNYYAHSPVDDPPGPAHGSTVHISLGPGQQLSIAPSKVLRGGSWYFKVPRLLRSDYRFHDDPSYRFDNYGFRCVRDF